MTLKEYRYKRAIKKRQDFVRYEKEFIFYLKKAPLAIMYLLFIWALGCILKG